MLAAAVLPMSTVGHSGVSAAGPSLQPSPQYAVRVDGEPAFVYLATTDGANVHNSSFVHITLHPGTSREVLVTVLQPMDPAHPSPGRRAAALRPEPARAGSALPVVRPRSVDGSTWSFTISQPLHAVLEFDTVYQLESLSSGLMVFVEFVDANPPDKADPTVRFFGAGVHELPLVPGWGVDKGSRGLELQSHQTLYLAEGAVLLGGIRAYNVQNITIKGFGIIAATFLPGAAVGGARESCQYCLCGGDHGIEIVNSSKVILDGVSVMHATNWDIRLQGLTDVHVSRVKVMAWRCWNDGIDVVSSRDVVIENVFIRSDDDSIAVKGMDPAMNTQNLVVRNSVFWNQRYGNCMEIGFELFNAQVRNITFEHNVCLHQSGSIMSIHNGGQSRVHDVQYRNIIAQTLASDQARGCDGNGCLMMFDMRVVYGQYCRVGPPPHGDGCSDPSLRGSIADVLMEDIQVHGNGLQLRYSALAGNSTAHGLDRISIRNFTIDGVRVQSLQDLNTSVGPFVTRVTVGG